MSFFNTLQKRFVSENNFSLVVGSTIAFGGYNDIKIVDVVQIAENQLIFKLRQPSGVDGSFYSTILKHTRN